MRGRIDLCNGGTLLEAKGKVLRVDGAVVTVEVARRSACSGDCKDCSGCTEQPFETTALTDMPVSIGDFVLLRSRHGAALVGMFVVFILPLLLPVAVYLFALPFEFAWILALIVLCTTLMFIWFLSKNKRFLAYVKPRVVEILPEENYK